MVGLLHWPSFYFLGHFSSVCFYFFGPYLYCWEISTMCFLFSLFLVYTQPFLENYQGSNKGFQQAKHICTILALIFFFFISAIKLLTLLLDCFPLLHFFILIKSHFIFSVSFQLLHTHLPAHLFWPLFHFRFSCNILMSLDPLFPWWLLASKSSGNHTVGRVCQMWTLLGW